MEIKKYKENDSSSNLNIVPTHTILLNGFVDDEKKTKTYIVFTH